MTSKSYKRTSSTQSFQFNYQVSSLKFHNDVLTFNNHNNGTQHHADSNPWRLSL